VCAALPSCISRLLHLGPFLAYFQEARYTLTRAHTRTHTRAHTHISVDACGCFQRTFTHALTNTCTYACTNALAPVQPRTCQAKVELLHTQYSELSDNLHLTACKCFRSSMNSCMTIAFFVRAGLVLRLVIAL